MISTVGTAIVNIGLLATPEGSGARSGKAQGELRKLKNAYLLSENGVITRIGTGYPSQALLREYEVIDAEGSLVTPGLIDAHTHLVFAGWRANELRLKTAGMAYLDILASGGGILSTVRETRAADEAGLFKKTHKVLDGMLAMGTTTCEAKSGYGLNLADELKQLRVMQQLNAVHPVEIVSTLMAAHAIPPEFTGDKRGYIDLIIDEIIPRAAQGGLAEFCDVFCEEGVFTADESAEILLAGQREGLLSKIHADEIRAIGGSELAGKIGAISAEHLIAMKDSGIEALKSGGSIACLLPGTSLYLGKPYARARDMIASGVPVAVASDFNPGSCPGYSLQLCMNLACWQYRMTPEETLCAVTLNAAGAVNRPQNIGSLEIGKQADAVIWDARDLDFLCYRFGSNLARTVIKKGRRVPREAEECIN